MNWGTCVCGCDATGPHGFCGDGSVRDYCAHAETGESCAE